MARSLKYIAFQIVFTLFSISIFSQTTTVKGKITDIKTTEPVAFTNVYFNGTHIGTISTFEGEYVLSSDTPVDSITVSLIGYEKLSLPVQQGVSQTIDFQLVPSFEQIEEIVIVPGENPAHPILRKVWDNKNSYNIDNCDAYEYQSYSKVQLYLRKFFQKADDERKIKILKDVYEDYAIQTGDEGIPALPVYMSESMSENYYNKFPEKSKSIVTASKTSGVVYDETNMLQQLTEKHQQYNFNENLVLIFNKEFISPISRSGLMYYKYYLVDSLFIDGKWCYEIVVKPKRRGDLAFKGTIWINDTTYALKRISVEVDKSASINFVQRIKIQQDMEDSGQGYWYPLKTRILADAVNIFVSSYTENKDFKFDAPQEASFYDKEIEIADTAIDATEDFWIDNRYQALSETDSATFNNIDNISHNPRIYIPARIIETSIKGYYNFDKFELGPYLLAYRQNDVEGHRFRLGGRTKTSFSKKWFLSGYSAYGTLDKQFKYNAQVERFLSRDRWTKIGVQYMDDVENVGAFDEFYSTSTFLTFSSSFGGTTKMNDIRVGRVWFETDFLKRFSQKLVFMNKSYSPLSSDYYFAYYTDDTKSVSQSDFQISEVSISTEYHPKTTYLIDGNRRFPVTMHKAPIWRINYTLGVKDVLNSDFNYHKLDLSLEHRFNFGGWGYFKYNVKATKIFNPLPYPLLKMFTGNETLFRNDRSYNLMNYGEFVADEALEIFYSYHPDGFFLNKIPLVKYLDMRLVTTGHFAFGSFDNSKNGFYDPTNNPTGILPINDSHGNLLTTFYTMDKNIPYIELSYGVENILKFFRVDLIQRFTYLDHANVDRLGVKVSGMFKF